MSTLPCRVARGHCSHVQPLPPSGAAELGYAAIVEIESVNVDPDIHGEAYRRNPRTIGVHMGLSNAVGL